MKRIIINIVATPIIFIAGISLGVFFGLFYLLETPIKAVQMLWRKNDEDRTECCDY